MRIVRTLESFPPDARPSVVALGVLDGVHLGHQAILRTAVNVPGVPFPCAATVSGTLSSAAASKRIDDFLASIFELLCAFSSPYGS